MNILSLVHEHIFNEIWKEQYHFVDWQVLSPRFYAHNFFVQITSITQRKMCLHKLRVE